MNTGEGDPDGRRHHPWPGASVQRLVLPGTVQAWYEAPIYARVNGYLEAWHFDYGAHVNKGDVLGEIKTPDVDAQLSAAQAKLNSAKSGGEGQGSGTAVRKTTSMTLPKDIRFW